MSLPRLNPTQEPLVFDHLRMIRNETYLRRCAKSISRLERRSLNDLLVVHEDDQRCCRREPWETTRVRLFTAAHPELGKTLLVDL